MKDYPDDRRSAPYTNSRMYAPALIWAILVTLVGNVVIGVVFAIRLEGAVEQNTAAIQVVDNKVDSEILHVKQLQEQQNDNVKEALEDAKEERAEIKALIREALKNK